MFQKSLKDLENGEKRGCILRRKTFPFVHHFCEEGIMPDTTQDPSLPGAHPA